MHATHSERPTPLSQPAHERTWQPLAYWSAPQVTSLNEVHSHFKPPHSSSHQANAEQPMDYWIFKQSDQSRYPDIPGSTYVYNNTHSRHVCVGDAFVYLDKRGVRYAFNGHGMIQNITRTVLKESDRQTQVDTTFSASLCDYIEYSTPLDMRYDTATGKRHRATLGVPDFNKQGWSISVARVDRSMFDRIIDLAYEKCITLETNEGFGYEISSDSSYVKRRHRQEGFRDAVFRRQGYICAICGTTLKAVLDIAHISEWARDISNRTNPANGIGMCVFCHRAFDRGIFHLTTEGHVTTLTSSGSDDVVDAHFPGIAPSERLELMRGVDLELLRKRYIG